MIGLKKLSLSNDFEAQVLNWMKGNRNYLETSLCKSNESEDSMNTDSDFIQSHREN